MYIGPPIDDPDLLDRLPPVYRDLLLRANGYVAYGGGLHVRGACLTPTWHSLRAAWEGPDALHQLFEVVAPTDVPFAEDAFGDQFLVRDGVVHRLAAELGELASLDLSLDAFDAAVRADPVEFLGLAPLERFRQESGDLTPGELLSVYPPFCTTEAAHGVSLRAVPALERRRVLAAFAAQVRGVPDGSALRIELGP